MPFKDNQVKMLFLELTTVCNAACPQCDRVNPALYNDDTDRAELTLDDMKSYFPTDFIAGLNKITFSGDLGDPTAATELFPIIRWLKSINPTMQIGMHTNGGARSAKWWFELASILTTARDYVVFSIDGLEDTNHIYRINVRWNKVIENLTAFIAGGGSAHWDMLVFEHNEHQVQEAKELAEKLGVRWFRTKVTRRMEKLPIQWLSLPKGYEKPKIPNISSLIVTPAKPTSCLAFNEQSITVSSTGLCLPCCFVGGQVFVQDSYMKSLVDFDKLRLSNNSITDIIPLLSDMIDKMRTEYYQCNWSCGINPDNTTPFSEQWRSSTEFPKA